MSAEETRDSIFKTILSIIANDSILCNYVRYMDYGKIINKENVRLWETIECCLNSNNKLNQTQIIRFVNNIDSRFLVSLVDLHSTMANNLYGSRSSYGITTLLKMQNAEIATNKINSTDNLMEIDQYILNRSINIDHTLKIKGLSLTLLDFINKNIKGVRTEKEFFRDILYFVNKLIFVGDKCHLLAITDINENVYVNLKCLENLYKTDLNVFKETVLRLFKVINKFCIYFANNSISQYVIDKIEYPLIVDIFKQSSLKNIKNDNGQIIALSDFTFNDDKETDDTIKTNITNIIENYTCRYLNNTCNIDSYDIPYLLRTVRTNLTKMIKDKLNKSFLTGLNIYNVCRNRGWELCDPENEPISAYLNKDYVYIKKTMNIVPNMAFIADPSSGRTKKRVLKDSAMREFHEKTRIEVKTIYLNVTNGTMNADATHPNVSGCNVCMGDIKGKISFTDSSIERISSMLSDCEALLTAINYTSPYNHNGERYFVENDYSYDFGQTASSTLTEDGQPSVIENVKSYDEEEFSDEISDDEE